MLSTSTSSSRRCQDDGEGTSQTVDDGSLVPPPDSVDPLHGEAGAPEALEGYLEGPLDLSLLTGYDRASQKFYYHGQKILSLQQPAQPWFQNVLTTSGMKDLCHIGYSTIHNRMLMAFADRWHSETSSFHLPHGEVTITLNDIACLLHIPIRGTLLCYGRMMKKEAREALIEELRDDLEDALEEVERNCGAYKMFHFLTQRYDGELLTIQLDAGDPIEVEILILDNM
ncbi:protein MAIN-LIKE 1-like [Vicia villosa]|uniref:protein MAIN-LIKE 1-like n=1 Tax=Vicia villosa TaxID=3911 RepID=UPI00273BA2C8|nr:protein MAIN-LIKE 1-like [Vicia villosa]